MASCLAWPARLTACLLASLLPAAAPGLPRTSSPRPWLPQVLSFCRMLRAMRGLRPTSLSTTLPVAATISATTRLALRPIALLRPALLATFWMLPSSCSCQLAHAPSQLALLPTLCYHLPTQCYHPAEPCYHLPTQSAQLPSHSAQPAPCGPNHMHPWSEPCSPNQPILLLAPKIKFNNLNFKLTRIYIFI